MPKHRDQNRPKLRSLLKTGFLILPILLIELLFFILPRPDAWEPVYWNWSRTTVFAVNSFIGLAAGALLFHFDILPPNFFAIMTEHWRNGLVLTLWLMLAIPVVGCLIGIVQVVRWLVSRMNKRSASGAKSL